MAIILKANKVNLFGSSVLFVFWYHSPNVLDTLHICNISWLRVKAYVASTAQTLGSWGQIPIRVSCTSVFFTVCNTREGSAAHGLLRKVNKQFKNPDD
jgi:hypothetical protein